jgi:hypothetical protein
MALTNRLCETVLSYGNKTILGVTANNYNESGKAVRRKIAKGET